MSDETSNEHGDGANQPAERKPRALMTIIKAVVFVSVIVVVEVVVASMLVPTTEDTTKLAKELAAASHGQDSHEEKHEEGGHGHGDEEADHHDLHEVELGTFHITRYNPTTNTTLAIDFELYGTVLASEEGDFAHTYEHSKARVREQITMTMHNAGSSDLTDAGLGLIKRQILEKTNRAIGEPLLKEVLFSKFNFVER